LFTPIYFTFKVYKPDVLLFELAVENAIVYGKVYIWLSQLASKNLSRSPLLSFRARQGEESCFKISPRSTRRNDIPCGFLSLIICHQRNGTCPSRDLEGRSKSVGFRHTPRQARGPAQPNLQLLHISVFFEREFLTAKKAYPAKIMAPLPQQGDGYFGGI
jgi:hypothetical protein